MGRDKPAVYFSASFCPRWRYSDLQETRPDEHRDEKNVSYSKNPPPNIWQLDRDWASPQRYPDPAIEIVEPQFGQLILGSAALQRLWTGGRWLEGPVWFGDWQTLLWSDIPNDRMLAWSALDGSVSTFRQPSNYANGNTRDRNSTLLATARMRNDTKPWVIANMGPK